MDLGTPPGGGGAKRARHTKQFNIEGGDGSYNVFTRGGTLGNVLPRTREQTSKTAKTSGSGGAFTVQ